MAKRDYYEVLGVERGVTKVELKKAYRKLALELHPDRNPDDATAEERFKEVSEAFAILNDEDKRATYDRFGHEGLSGAGGAGFQDMGDIFSQFGDLFGDIFGGRRGRTQGPRRGADLRTGVQLTLEEAAFGVKKEISLAYPGPCAACHGTGAHEGKVVTCTRCHGSGQVAHQRGPFLMQTPCPTCQGAGSTADKPCGSCRGSGQEEIERTVKVTFPEGIDAGQTLRVPDQGVPSRSGGPPGHLYVEVDLKPHDVFERAGADLVRVLELTYPQAVLGTKVWIKTLDGDAEEVKVPSGIQPGDTIKLRGKGVAHLNRGGHGDIVLVARVVIPKKISSKQKKLLKELQALDG